MGPSGCGKSTLAKLLQGFYQPSAGRILIDGVDIRYLSANELRSHFGVVPQETMLFSGTIYDNLQMASPNATFRTNHSRLQAWPKSTASIEAQPQGLPNRNRRTRRRPVGRTEATHRDRPRLAQAPQHPGV